MAHVLTESGHYDKDSQTKLAFVGSGYVFEACVCPIQVKYSITEHYVWPHKERRVYRNSKSGPSRKVRNMIVVLGGGSNTNTKLYVAELIVLLQMQIKSCKEKSCIRKIQRCSYSS